MKIQLLETKAIKAYKNNPRDIPKEAVAAVADSIKEFGFNTPIVVDRNNTIVTGHTRLLAAKRLRLKKVPVVKATDLKAEQIKQFRVVDNRVAEMSEWDSSALKAELRAMGDTSALENLFSKDELDDMLSIGKIDQAKESSIQKQVETRTRQRAGHQAEASKKNLEDKISFACPCCGDKITVSKAAIERAK